MLVRESLAMRWKPVERGDVRLHIVENGKLPDRPALLVLPGMNEDVVDYDNRVRVVRVRRAVFFFFFFFSTARLRRSSSSTASFRNVRKHLVEQKCTSMVPTSAFLPSFLATLNDAPLEMRCLGESVTPESQPNINVEPRNTGRLWPITVESTVNENETVSGRGVTGEFVPGPAFLHTAQRDCFVTSMGKRIGRA